MDTSYTLPETNQVGAFEAKTHFSQILREVEKGRTVEITRRGKTVAFLSSTIEPERKDMSELVERIHKTREKLRARGVCVTKEEILEWRDEGRRF